MTYTDNTATEFAAVPAVLMARLEMFAHTIRNEPNTAAAEQAEERIATALEVLEAMVDPDTIEAVMEHIDGIACLPAA